MAGLNNHINTYNKDPEKHYTLMDEIQISTIFRQKTLMISTICLIHIAFDLAISFQVFICQLYHYMLNVRNNVDAHISD